MQQLRPINDRQREAYIKARGRLLEFLDQGRLIFRKDELTDGIAESPKQADNIITNMRQVGFMYPTVFSHRTTK